MSYWTYVTGIVRADTAARTSAEAVYIGQTVIDHLPRVRGSEGDARLHVYLEDGHSMWSDDDEYGNRSNLCNDRTFGGFEFQSNVLITISGRLRDTTFGGTFREAAAMLCRMAKRLYIDSCAVLVRDDRGKSFAITDGGWLRELYEGFREPGLQEGTAMVPPGTLSGGYDTIDE